VVDNDQLDNIKASSYSMRYGVPPSVWDSDKLRCIMDHGAGQVELQSRIATPTFRGHVIYDSRQLLQSLMTGKQASKGCRKIQSPEANPALNQAKGRMMIHRSAKIGFPAMVYSDLSFRG
jgi:hypothetical protein